MSKELLNACKKGDLNQVKILLADKNNTIDIYYKNNFGLSALMYACQFGHINIVIYLLTSNDLIEHANIHDREKYEHTALMCACCNGHLNIVDYLLTSKDLKERANMYDKDKDGWNALMFSCAHEYWEVAQYLIINHNMNIDQQTMDWLIKNEHQKVLDMLQTRDLYYNLNDSLATNDKIINKRKI